MSKKSIIEREKKRTLIIKKYLHKRNEIKLELKSCKDLSKKNVLFNKLQSLPRNSSLVRSRNRCFVTGRSRGYFRLFGLSRHVFREMAHYGLLPGVTKSSW